MSNPLYSSLQATTTDLLKRFGALCSITREQILSEDPVLGSKTSESTTFTAAVVSITLTSDEKLEEFELETTSTTNLRRVFLIEATPNGLQLQDLLSFGSETYRILGISRYAPDSTIIAFRAKGELI